jgi:hypothetical protein
MTLTELVNYVSRAWTPPPKNPGRQTMVIPAIVDLRDGRQAAKVQSQCQLCAKQLAGHLYVWRRSFPQQPTVKSWDAASLTFQGMDLDLFRDFLMRNFVLKTPDGKEWALDRVVAAAIWAACIAADSPLPPASWQIEMDRKRLAARK